MYIYHSEMYYNNNHNLSILTSCVIRRVRLEIENTKWHFILLEIYVNNESLVQVYSNIINYIFKMSTLLISTYYFIIIIISNYYFIINITALLYYT